MPVDVATATYLEVDHKVLAATVIGRPEELRLSLTGPHGTNLPLELRRTEIYAPGFKVVAGAEQDKALPLVRPVVYTGTVGGQVKSMVTVVVTRRNVHALIVTEGESYQLAPLDRSERAGVHRLFDVADVLEDVEAGRCGTPHVTEEVDKLPEVPGEKNGGPIVVDIDL